MPSARTLKTVNWLERFTQNRVLGILRDVEQPALACIAQACATARVDFLEVTMNTDDAARKIRRLVELTDGKVEVGAGTVCTVAELNAALAAGASFIVAPVLVPEVQREALAREIPILPGALTPTEIFQARRAGATMVKVFPAGRLGPSYFRDLRGPFRHLPLLACGGVDANNAAQYRVAGADGVAVGAGTFRTEWLKRGNVEALRAELASIVDACRVSAGAP